MPQEQSLVVVIERALPNIVRGSLVVFGDIFGGRVDNIHQVIGASLNEDGSTTVRFDQGETLTVWEPEGFEISATTFKVLRARRVLWEWFYYGREHVAENRCFIEHRAEGTRVEATSNQDGYGIPFAPASDSPAVELIDPYASN